MRKYRIPLISAVTAAAVLVPYHFIGWEWGIMDDTNWVRKAHAAVASHGLLSGIARNTLDLIRFDMHSFGFFRFAQWFYCSLVYLLSPALAYDVRLVLFAGVVALTASALQKPTAARKEAIAFCVALMLANRSLYDGLSIVFVSELNGLLFLALGLWLGLTKPAMRWSGWLELACYVIATGFKPPFVAVLIVFAFLRYRLGQRKLAVASGALFALLLAIAVRLSRGSGTYATRIFHAGIASAATTVSHASAHLLPVAVAFGIFAIFARPWTLAGLPAHDVRAERRRVSYGVMLLLSGVAYLAILAPREITKGMGYYLSPVVYMLTVGILLLSLPAIETVIVKARARMKPALAAAFAIAIAVGSYSIAKGLRRNESIKGLRDWALTLRHDGGIGLAMNSREAPIRLWDILNFRTGDNWRNPIVPLAEGDLLPQGLKYYIVFDDQLAPNLRAQGKLIRAFPSAKVYEVF